MNASGPVQIALQQVLGTSCFAEVGNPTGVFWNADQSLFAVTSSFGWKIGWAAKYIGSRVRFRVCLYETKTLRRVAVLDALEWPVHEVSFHPTKRLLAIATGEYDGGYLYEGKLLLWDVELGRISPVYRDNRECTRCRFTADGEQLYFVTRPHAEEDDAGNSLDNVFYTFVMEAAETLVDLEDVKQTELSTAGFDQPYVRPRPAEARQTLQALADRSSQAYEPRWHLWDLAWAAESELLSASEQYLLERWSAAGQRLDAIGNAGEGHGIQLLLRPGGNEVFINRYHAARDNKYVPVQHSTILRYDWQSGALTPVIAAVFPFSLSKSERGDLLARDCGDVMNRRRTDTRDLLIGPDLRMSAPLNLGNYDCFNHYLRIDGARDLFFLQATPPNSYNDQWVCSITPSTGKCQRLFRLAPPPDETAHYGSDGGCYVEDESGESVVLALRLHAGPTVGWADSRLVRRSLPSGRVCWSTNLQSHVTALAPVPAYNLVAFALSDGTLGLMSTTDGRILQRTDAQANGTPSVIMSLACRGGQLAAGTIHGTILCYQITVDPLP